MIRRLGILSVIVIVLYIGFSGTSSLAQGNGPATLSNPTAGKWYVSTLGNDSNTCTSPVSPCETIQAANTRALDGDTIYVAIGKYKYDGNGTEVLRISKNLNFSGSWNETFKLQNGVSYIYGDQIYPCVVVEYDYINVTIDHFSITHCNGPTAGGIINWGKLVLQNSAVEFNPKMGIDNYREGDITLVDSIVRNNESPLGAGIANDGKLTLIRSTVTHNIGADYGGGIRFSGLSLLLINSTISNNTSNQGGGIYIDQGSGELKIYNSTIVNNYASSIAGGVLASDYSYVLIQNSILANNRVGNVAPDCFGTINSGGYNIIGNTEDCTFNATTGDLLNTQPRLFPISFYFGLQSSSPAIDAGNPIGCMDDLGSLIQEDQRHTSRPLDGNQDGIAICDIGSFELDPEHPIVQNYLPIMKKPCPILYYDSFSNPDSGWPIVNTGETLFEYNNGEYRILEYVKQQFGGARPGFKAQDYKVSVDLRNVTGVAGSYGIMFGIAQDWSGWYTLEIYPDGWYGIYRYDVYGGSILAEAYSPSIKQGTASNKISVERNGSSIKAYANGDLLASATDSYFSGMLYLGLINYAYDQPNVDIRYDNFAVNPLYCSQSGLETEYSSNSSAEWYMFDKDDKQPGISFGKHQP